MIDFGNILDTIWEWFRTVMQMSITIYGVEVKCYAMLLFVLAFGAFITIIYRVFE